MDPTRRDLETEGHLENIIYEAGAGEPNSPSLYLMNNGDEGEANGSGDNGACRGGITTDAIGWLKLGQNGHRRIRGGMSRKQAHTDEHMFTQVQGPHGEVKPLLLLV